MTQKFYRLESSMYIDHEYDSNLIEFFLDKESANKRKEELIEHFTKSDGTYISNITDLQFNITIVTFNKMKTEITLSQFERLFNVNLNLDDLIK